MNQAVKKAISGTRACGNKVTDAIAKDGWVVEFSHPKTFQIQKNNLLATLPHLPLEWQVGFKMMPNKQMTDQQRYGNVLFMTVDGSWETHSGYATPAVFFDPKMGLVFGSSVKVKYKLGHYWTSNLKILEKEKNEWTDIKISQELLNGKFIYKVFIDGIEVVQRENERPMPFRNVKVFAGAPSKPVFDGWMKMLSIKVKESVQPE